MLIRKLRNAQKGRIISLKIEIFNKIVQISHTDGAQQSLFR